MTQPNIVYFHSHDTGRYIQPYGHAIPTPNYQRLAEDGVLFRQAFCVNPTSSPSRAGLLTGQCAHSCGMLGLVNRGWTLEHPERHIAHTLSASGYETVLAGLQHVVKDVSTSGYTRLLGKEAAAAGRKAEPDELALEFLEVPRAKPFFLDVGYILTHRIGRGFGAPPAGEPPTDPRYVKVPPPFADTAPAREDMALYIDAARKLDARLGRVLSALDRKGLRENTLFIATTDHGIAFPEMKCHLTDHGTGVLLIVRGPGEFAGGKACDALVSQMDIFPTVCELAGIPKPAWLQGASLLPLVRGETEALREELFAEVNFHACHEPMRSVRTARFKYIRRFDRRTSPVLVNCDPSLTKDLRLALGWKERVEAEERLHDLAFDPLETCNLAGDAAHAGVLADLRARLERWMRETHDPLLTHAVLPAPETGQLNLPDAVEHTEELLPAREVLRRM